MGKDMTAVERVVINAGGREGGGVGRRGAAFDNKLFARGEQEPVSHFPDISVIPCVSAV